MLFDASAMVFGRIRNAIDAGAIGQIRNAIGIINEMDAGAIQSNTDCNLMLVLFGLILDAGAIWSDTECNGCNGRSTASAMLFGQIRNGIDAGTIWSST